jgi:hypothetical protein
MTPINLRFREESPNYRDDSAAMLPNSHGIPICVSFLLFNLFHFSLFSVVIKFLLNSYCCFFIFNDFG